MAVRPWTTKQRGLTRPRLSNAGGDHDLDFGKAGPAGGLHLRAARIATDHREALDAVDLVDIVAPTPRHQIRHERERDGLWRPTFGNAIIPKLEPRGAVEVLPSSSAMSRSAPHPRPTSGAVASPSPRCSKRSPSPPEPTAQ
jgi:hypothetical protein